MNLTTTDKELTMALSVVMTNAQNWNKQRQQSNERRSSGQQGDQDNSSQSELLNYEILHVPDNDPLFQLKYVNQ